MGPISRNFDFLEAFEPDLARLGALAEWAFHQDAPTALGKMRQFAEHMAKSIAARNGLDLVARANFDDTLRALQQEGKLPRQAADVFHFLRRYGNAAVHENLGTPRQALTGLKLARELGVWFVRAYGPDSKFTAGAFSPPQPPKDATADLTKEIERLRGQLAATEGAAEKAQREAAEAARGKLDAEALARREADERIQWEELAAEEAAARDEVQRTLDRLRSEAQSQTPAVMAKLMQAAETADAAIELDEADTRVLIDAKLAAAGWTVDSTRLRHAAGTRPDSAPAIAIGEWPTATGPVDYALFFDGRCVGLIEAKRGRTDVPGVLVQTGRYAAGVTLSAEQRLAPALAADAPGGVPFLFATNGRPYVKQMETKSGIWFRDARRASKSADGAERLVHAAGPEGEAGADHRRRWPRGRDLRLCRHSPLSAGGDQGDRGGARTRPARNPRRHGDRHGQDADLHRPDVSPTQAQEFRRILFLVDRNELGKQTLRALANTELEGLLKFDESYNVAGLDKKLPEREDRVHVATVQAMVKRVISRRGGR